MTEVVANYNINMNEFASNMAVEGFQSAEVEAIMKAVGENKTWNAIEGLNDTNADLQGLRGDTTAQNVDKRTTPADVIEMAKFAVEEYNKRAGTHLVFIKVLRYIKRVVRFGTFYGLFIETQDDKGTHHDQALTFKSKTGKKTLVWYKHNGEFYGGKLSQLCMVGRTKRTRTTHEHGPGKGQPRVIAIEDRLKAVPNMGINVLYGL